LQLNLLALQCSCVSVVSGFEGNLSAIGLAVRDRDRYISAAKEPAAGALHGPGYIAPVLPQSEHTAARAPKERKDAGVAGG
jgi:hypothetical protein